MLDPGNKCQGRGWWTSIFQVCSGHVCVFPHLCDPSGWLTFDVEVVRVLEHVSLMLLDCSSIFDDVVEPGAHLRQGFPGVPHDLVGVVAEREPDALLVGSV